MIVLQMQMWRHGDPNQMTILGEAKIINTGTGTDTDGHYIFKLAGKNGRPWKKGVVTGFPRKRLLAWDLLYRCLKEVIGDRNQ